MNHWALKWRLDPNIISVWSISWIGRENIYKLGQVDTKYIILPWGHYNKQCSAAPTYGAFLLSVRTSWLEGWVPRSRAASTFSERLLMRRKTARLFPSIIFPRSTDFLFSAWSRQEEAARSTFHFFLSRLSTVLPTLFISSQQSHFVRPGHLLSSAVSYHELSIFTGPSFCTSFKLQQIN